jgi:DNA-directed RNA polymerase specialized sigma24 family protein
MTITKATTAVLLSLLGALFFGPIDCAIAQIAVEIAPRIEMTPGDFGRIDLGNDPYLATRAALNPFQVKTVRGIDDGGLAGALNNQLHVKAPGAALPADGPPDVPLVLSRGKPDDCASKITQDDLRSLKNSLGARDYNNVDDAIQEAVIAYLEECRKGVVIGKPDRWLFVTAKNKLFNIQRGERTRSKIEGSAFNSPTDEFGLQSLRTSNDFITPSRERELYEASRNLAGQLSFDQLTALHGKYVEDLTASEIACRAGVPLTKAQCRLRKGDKVLAGVVREMGTPVPPMPFPGNTTAYTTPEYESDGLGFIVILIALAIGIALICSKLANAVKANTAARASAAAEANAAAAYHQYQAYAAHAAAQRAAQSRGRYMNG